MKKCKSDVSTFAFLFWLDVATLFILIPWSIINGEWEEMWQEPEGAGEWVKFIFTAVLGGVRFFSQLLVLRVTTATNLSVANVCYQAINIYFSVFLGALGVLKPTVMNAAMICGSLTTISLSSLYVWLKISKKLSKDEKCVKIGKDFAAVVPACCGCVSEP